MNKNIKSILPNLNKPDNFIQEKNNEIPTENLFYVNKINNNNINTHGDINNITFNFNKKEKENFINLNKNNYLTNEKIVGKDTINNNNNINQINLIKKKK